MKNALVTLIVVAMLGFSAWGFVATVRPDVTPTPDVVPDVTPEPEPEPTPPPFAVAEGVAVLILEETDGGNTTTQAQRDAIDSLNLREWFRDNRVAWRRWDQNVDNLRETEPWKSIPVKPDPENDSQTVVDLAHESLPWVFIATPTRGYSGPLPGGATDAEVHAAIVKLVGEFLK